MMHMENSSGERTHPWGAPVLVVRVPSGRRSRHCAPKPQGFSPQAVALSTNRDLAITVQYSSSSFVYAAENAPLHHIPQLLLGCNSVYVTVYMIDLCVSLRIYIVYFKILPATVGPKI